MFNLPCTSTSHLNNIINEYYNYNNSEADNRVTDNDNEEEFIPQSDDKTESQKKKKISNRSITVGYKKKQVTQRTWTFLKKNEKDFWQKLELQRLKKCKTNEESVKIFLPKFF